MNESGLDRVVRILAGAALVYVAWLAWPETSIVATQPITWNLVVLVIGVIGLFTGVVGWCPVYTLFNVSTKKRAGA
jgi:hypothetical protein